MISRTWWMIFGFIALGLGFYMYIRDKDLIGIVIAILILFGAFSTKPKKQFVMDPKTQRERDEAVKRKYIYKPVFIIFGILNLLIIALFVISLQLYSSLHL